MSGALKSQSLIVVRWAVKVAECDCCDDKTLHLPVQDQTGTFYDIQFDVEDWAAVQAEIERQMGSEDIEYLVPPANGQAIARVEWTVTKEGVRRGVH